MKNSKAVIILCIFCISLFGCTHDTKPPLGLNSHKELMPCPNSPNCVSSFENNQAFIEPLDTHLSSSPILKLKTCLKSFPRINIIEETQSYLRATAESSFFGFIDDLEFLLIDNRIYIRSASRSGYYDFNVNRERIEAIRQAYKRDCR